MFRSNHHYILLWCSIIVLEDLLFIRQGIQEKPISQLDHLLQLDVTELPDTDSLFEVSTRFYKRNVMLHKYLGQHVPYFSAGGCAMYSGNAASCFG